MVCAHSLLVYILVLAPMFYSQIWYQTWFCLRLALLLLSAREAIFNQTHTPSYLCLVVHPYKV